MKKLISVLLVLAMVLTLAPMALASEEAVVEEDVIIDQIEEIEEEAAEPIDEPVEVVTEEPIDEPAEAPAQDGATSGKCGDNVTWSLSGSTLMISGTGEMQGYTTADDAPWWDSHNSIKTIQIGNGVTRIGRLAFSQCTALTSVTIAGSVKSIGAGAFVGCDALSSIELPSGITSIERAAFEACKSLTSITLPENLTTISQELFRECPSLTSITIPAGITSIEERAFGGCKAIKQFKVGSTSKSFKSEGGILFTSDGKTLVCYPPAKEGTSYTIPSGVTCVEAWAFEDCAALKSITIPDSVITLGNYVFASCTSLESIRIPDSMTELPSGAFSGCTSLKEIRLPSGLTDMGSSVFQDCSSLKSVTIPAKVSYTGLHVFANCTGLKSIFFTGDAPRFWDNAFWETTTTAYYPAGNATWTADKRQNYGGNITWVGYRPLTSANVTGLEEPAVGRTGDTSVSVPSGANYSVSSVTWYDTTGDTGGAPLTGSWTFKAGHEYTCTIGLEAASGYDFLRSFAATVNGENVYRSGLLGSGDTSSKAWIDYTVLLEEAPQTVTVTLDGNGGQFSVMFGSRIRYADYVEQTVTVGEPYGALAEPTRDGYTFAGYYSSKLGGIKITKDTVCKSTEDHILYAHWTKEGSSPAEPLALTFAADGKSAAVTGDWTGLYARVALILDNGGVSGLYVTQATINADGTVLVPEFMVPGLKVKGVNVSLVPTLADIQSATPNVVATASKML